MRDIITFALAVIVSAGVALMAFSYMYDVKPCKCPDPKPPIIIKYPYPDTMIVHFNEKIDSLYNLSEIIDTSKIDILK